MKVNGIGFDYSLRKLNETEGVLGKQIKKLSSLQQITSAADNAAGLAIANRLATQMSGLSQSQLNIQDSMSAVQVAEGGLEQINGMQQRLRDLAVQASNGTLTDEDRQMINAEAQQLTEEINRQAGTVEFNGQKLLTGQYAKGTGDLTVQAGANEGETININIEASDTNALGLNNIDLSTANGASSALQKIDQSISYVSSQRANLGAMTNRLESTYNFNGIQNEAQTSSFSQIMETNVAQEMMKYTSTQLLQKSGMAMLAQGNLQRRSVLSLIGIQA